MFQKVLRVGDYFHQFHQAKSSSYKHYYQAANEYNNFVTHSEFQPYITKVGLYNDFNELIAIGQLSHPIKNDEELALL